MYLPRLSLDRYPQQEAADGRSEGGKATDMVQRWVTVPRNAADRPKFTTIQNNVAVQVPVPVGVRYEGK